MSQGTIHFPIQVGPTIMETTCQVLDLELHYNIILGNPWIHGMKYITFTFHHCVKFLYQNREVTIHADLKPFYYCKNLKAKYYKIPQVPKNYEGPTSPYVDPSTLASTSNKMTHIIQNILDIKALNKDNGCGDYNLQKGAYVVGELPQSLKSHGRPQPSDGTS